MSNRYGFNPGGKSKIRRQGRTGFRKEKKTKEDGFESCSSTTSTSKANQIARRDDYGKIKIIFSINLRKFEFTSLDLKP